MSPLTCDDVPPSTVNRLYYSPPCFFLKNMKR